ncbi:Pol [Symbiodinium natans]|uniref:Pol protein n=1 Tax=Symbiodinium natans TaxID=878477 RepID=A0A812GUA9_9DINO|nr:Pol [Symbiodinium natans]
MDVRSLCWNVGGLSGSCFQELVAWLDVEGGCYDVIILQETHWRASSDFRSGQWMCVHSSGYDSELSLDRYGGILIMINQDAFQEPAAHEIYPGRLLHVRALHRRSRLNVDIIGIYQHVYRPQLTPDLNQQYRSDVWTKLSTALQALPSRNPLLLGGDFNSQLAARRPHVGCSLLSGDGQQGDKQLHKLLEKCDLCVLNSWHAKPGHTYESTTSRTRIDFVVTKLSDAKGPARYAKPKYNFPIKAYSLAGHWPIEATIAVVPFNRRPPAKPADCVTFQRDELLVHTRTNSERAQALQQDVASRLAQVQPSSLQDARAIVNQVLLETAAVHFPPEIRPDSRISAQDSFRASAKTTWQFYRALKAPCIAVTHGIFLKWKAASDFSKASRRLRDQSRLLKRESLLRKLAEAEQAAAKGDQRVLHQIVRGLAPRCQKLVSRLRDPQGQLLGKDAALQAMLNYAKDTFCILPDEPDIPAMQDSWQCTDQDVQRELQKLGVFKAVPAGIAPAALWRCCAGAIAPVLGNSLRHHFQAGSTQCLQDELHDAYITLVPKPQKPAIAVENLRPIGLQCPSAKLIAGLLRQSLLEVLLPLITNLPQYAYAKHRGTFDALLRVHLHFEDASVLLRTNRVNRFQQHSGRKQHACVGGLSLSLDLSRAYDLTSRPIVYGTLAQHGVTQDTITIIKQLHRDAQYIFRSGDTTGGQPTTNGLKQGCCIAPFLWSFYTIALMHALQDKLGPQWLQKTLVLFADDHWCHWLVKNKKDWDDAINELVVVLETLTTFKMSINYRKTAILVRLEGKQAKAILHEHTRLKNGVRHLVITVHGEEQLIPVKDEHEYLGTKVTYQHRLDKNLAHRVQAGQAKYIALRKPLNGKHHLTIHHRTRLWLACVSTSMLYSLSAVGITKHGLERLTKACTKHLRAIQKQPAHVTRIPNRDIWTQAGLDMPGSLLLTALQRFQQNLLIKAVASPDITTQECILAHVQQLVASLQALIAQQAEHDDAPPEPETPQIPCPECDAMFVTENAMRIHCQVAHKLLPPRAASTPVKFVPRIHACGGLPRCQLCLRSFYRWQNLRVHIESGACEKLGGESLSKHPISATDAQVADNQLPVPAVAPDDAATGTQQNVPLIDRALFRNRQHDWESLLREPQLRIDLQTHCSLCHMTDAAGLNPEADIFAFCDPSLLQRAAAETLQEELSEPSEMSQPPKRPRPEPSPLFGQRGKQQPHRQAPFAPRGPRWPKQQPPMDPQSRAMAKLMLQHEEMLAAQRVDKVFIMFMRQDYASIIPNLHSISEQWHKRRQDNSSTSELQSPLRTLLMACLIKEILARIQKMASTSEGQGKLKAAGWMNETGGWTFLRYCHRSKKMVLDASRESMSHQEIVRQYTFLLEHMKGEIVQKFNSTQSLKSLEANASSKPPATFVLEISLRGEKANEMHETMCTLIGSSAWQLVGISLKRGTLKKSPLAEQLAQWVYGLSKGYGRDADRKGRIRKTAQWYDIPRELEVPLFLADQIKRLICDQKAYYYRQSQKSARNQYARVLPRIINLETVD